jgi:lipid-A-disaccharide synthase
MRKLVAIKVLRRELTRVPEVMARFEREAMAAADIVVLASGTATLEAALLKTPMVIAYRMSPITAALMWRMRRLPYVGLPNILAGEFLVPEFLQSKATPGALSAAVISLMQDAERQRRQVEKFREIHVSLRQNAAEKAAAAVLAVLDRAHA